MPRRKKKRTFSATKAVKAAARATIGTPPAVRRVEDKKHRKKDKHKATIGKLLAEPEG